MGFIESLAQALADRVMTNAEWEALAPVLSPQNRATADASRLLEAWGSADRIDTRACVAIEEALERRGYAIPGPSCSARGATAEVRASNPTEADAAFTRLRGVVTPSAATLAVIDDGIDVRHHALSEHVLEQRDFIDGDGDARGGQHGTHVAGLAVGNAEGARLLAYRAIDSSASLSAVAPVVKAIDAAAAAGARVINLSESVRGEAGVAAVLAAIDRHPNVLFVVASGNQGLNLDADTPAAFLAANRRANMIVVGSTDASGRRVASSNDGASVGLLAPGENVFSSVWSDSYARLSGTSMAAPFVSNTVIKMVMLDPTLTPSQIADVLTLTAGARQVNRPRALQLVVARRLVREGATAGAALARVSASPSERSALARLL